MPGWQLAILGPIGPLAGLQFGWYANLFMFWGIARALFQQRIGFVSAGLGLILASSVFFWRTTPTDAGESTVCSLNIGFYLWFTCAMILAISAGTEYIWKSRKKGVKLKQA